MQAKTGIKAVFIRECVRVLNSRICIWGMIVAPLLSMAVMLYMMNEGLPLKTPIAVVDHDNSSTSRSLIRQLDAFPKTDITHKCLSFNEARHLMEKMEVFAVLEIPTHFGRDASTGRQPKLVYYTNNAFMVSGSLLFQDLKTVSTLAAASVGLKTGTAQGYAEVQIMPVVQPITLKGHPQNNPWLNYSLYLNNVIVPSILFLIILMFTVSSFGSEIKSGSARSLISMGNNSILKVVIGKTLPYTLIFMTIALIFMIMFYGYMHFPLKNGFLPMFFNYLFLVLAGQSMGVAIMAIYQNYRFALSIASLLGVVTFSIVGFSFPITAMSSAFYAISYLFPVRYFFLIYVQQALNGVPLSYSLIYYAGLMAFSLMFVPLLPRLKKYMLENEYEE